MKFFRAKEIFFIAVLVFCARGAFCNDIETSIIYHGFNDKQKEYFVIIDKGEDGGIRKGAVYEVMSGGIDVGELRIQGLLDDSATGVLTQVKSAPAPEIGARISLRDIASMQTVESLPAEAAVTVSPEQVSARNDIEYRLGPGDVISIKTWPVSLLPDSVTIRPDGSVDLPYVGKLNCNNLTTHELSIKLKDRMIKDFKRPWVEISILEYRSRVVRISGDLSALNFTPAQTGSASGLSSIEIPLKSPQVFLLDLISSIGGLSKEADAEHVRVIFSGGTSKTVDFKKLMKDPESPDNVLLHDGDRIHFFIMPEEKKKVRVMLLGKVDKQGVHELEPDSTQLVEALSMAGGALAEARLNKVFVYRMAAAETEGKPQVFTMDFSRMMVGEAPPLFALEEGDVVYVPGRKKKDMDAFNKVIGAVSPSISLYYLIDRLWLTED